MDSEKNTLERATFSRRLIASILDFIFCIFISTFIYYFFGDIKPPEGYSKLETILYSPTPSSTPLIMSSVNIAATFISLLYTLCEVFFAKTLGKKLVGLEIAGNDGFPASTSALFFRWFLKNGAIYIPFALMFFGVETVFSQLFFGLWLFVIAFGFLRVLQDHRLALHDLFSKTSVVVKE